MHGLFVLLAPASVTLAEVAVLVGASPHIQAVLEVTIPQVVESHVLPAVHLPVDILKVEMSKPTIPGLLRLRNPIHMVRNRIIANPLWKRETKRSAFLECGEEIVAPRLDGVELLRNLTPGKS